MCWFHIIAFPTGDALRWVVFFVTVVYSGARMNSVPSTMLYGLYFRETRIVYLLTLHYFIITILVEEPSGIRKSRFILAVKQKVVILPFLKCGTKYVMWIQYLCTLYVTTLRNMPGISIKNCNSSWLNHV